MKLLAFALISIGAVALVVSSLEQGSASPVQHFPGFTLFPQAQTRVQALLVSPPVEVIIPPITMPHSQPTKQQIGNAINSITAQPRQLALSSATDLTSVALGLRDELLKHFYSLAQNVLGFSLQTAPDQQLSPQQLTALTQALIQDNQAPQFKTQERQLISAFSPSPSTTSPPSVSAANLIVKPPACVSRVDCYRDGRTVSDPKLADLGFEFVAPSCRLCLRICPGAAIWDGGCTNICGCNPFK